jgi:hypothetical protein
MSQVLCPSSRAKEGALLFGVFVGDTVAYLQPAVVVSEEDLKEAGDHLEERFRFSLPCLHSECHNFTEGRCGLIQRLLRETQETKNASASEPDSEGIQHLPNCDIRPRCQWFKTAGERACGVCPLVHHPSY